tara:strand:- start:3104 stop:4432 length:1329 start_codon:yes stop_codon:yes gene_type:complete
MSLPALTGCIQSGGAAAPATPSAAPSITKASWTQSSVGISSEWNVGSNLPSKPMHTINSVDGSAVADTAVGLAFSINTEHYSAGNEILELRVDFEPSNNAVARENAGIGTGALPAWNINGIGATTSLRLVREGLTPTLNLPAISGKGVLNLDLLSLANTQYGGTNTVSFTNATMLSSFKITLYFQIMGDNGVAGNLLTHTFTPIDEWHNDPFIIGPTTYIPQVTMKLRDWMTQQEIGDPALTEYTGIFNWDAGTATVPIQRADGSNVRHTHNLFDGSSCQEGWTWQIELGWNFGTDINHATIPAVIPDQSEQPNSINNLTITIAHTSGSANLPQWSAAWSSAPFLVMNGSAITGIPHQFPFQFMIESSSTIVPIGAIAYLHEEFGLNEDDGVLEIGYPRDATTSSATFTFGGTVVDAYNQTVDLATLGTPITIPATFIQDCP